jgi:hypothetical protein
VRKLALSLRNLSKVRELEDVFLISILYCLKSGGFGDVLNVGVGKGKRSEGTILA